MASIFKYPVIFLVLGVLAISCNRTKYKVHVWISKVGTTGSEDIHEVGGQNDTTAFKNAVSYYWIHKGIAEHFEKKYNSLGLDHPYHFMLYKYEGNDSTIITLDSASEVKYATPVIELIKKIQEKDWAEEEKNEKLDTPKPHANIY